MCAKEQVRRLVKTYFSRDVRWAEFDIVFNYYVRRDMMRARVVGDWDDTLDEFSVKYKVSPKEVRMCSERNDYVPSRLVVSDIMGLEFQQSLGATC